MWPWSMASVTCSLSCLQSASKLNSFSKSSAPSSSSSPSTRGLPGNYSQTQRKNCLESKISYSKVMMHTHTCTHACIMAPGRGWVLRETDRLYKAPTFVTFVSGLALRAWLVSIVALIIIAGAADRECTFIASYKELTLGGQADIIPTDLTNVPIDMLQRFWLQHQPQTRQDKHRTSFHVMSCHVMSPPNMTTVQFL